MLASEMQLIKILFVGEKMQRPTSETLYWWPPQGRGGGGWTLSAHCCPHRETSDFHPIRPPTNTHSHVGAFQSARCSWGHLHRHTENMQTPRRQHPLLRNRIVHQMWVWSLSCRVWVLFTWTCLKQRFHNARNAWRWVGKVRCWCAIINWLLQQYRCKVDLLF